MIAGWWWLVGGLILHLCVLARLDAATSSDAGVIRLGYLTGSRRLPSDRLYNTPGLYPGLYNTPGRSISGAISLAVDEINADQQVDVVTL